MKIIIYFILLCFSLIANFGVFCFFRKEQSLYFSLLIMISLFEISFIFSKFISIANGSNSDIVDKIKNKLEKRDLLDKITFNVLKKFDFIKNNEHFYKSAKSLYLFLNIILCIETINLVTRPFSQSKKKTTIYYSISALFIIIIFCSHKFIDTDKYPKILNTSLYLLFIIVGIISLIFVVLRFCLNRPLIQSAKNFFVMRHFLYILVLSAMFFNELEYIEYSEFIQNVIIFCLGFVMSIIKISDELFLKDKKSKKNSKKTGVASIITSNLNVEFMCCILYGMTDIFIKNQGRQTLKINDLKKDKKIHTIKYINTIDSKMEGIKDIKLHVTLQTGESLLNKADNDEGINSESNNYSFSEDNKDSKGEDAFITEYLPVSFDDLRKNDEINDDVMIKAFSPSKNKSAIDKMSESKGKSGSFFFYSHDRKFIIKTVSGEERDTLLNIFHDYFNYMKNHKATLITKIYGIYTVVINNASSVNVILMQNLFGCSPIHIQRMFDLKGSSVQRKTKDVQKWRRDQVLKDLDYQWLTKVERKLINFKEEDITEIKSNLVNDIKFYKRLRLMDYSLLFIIIDFPNKIDPDYNQIVGLLEDPKYRGHVYRSQNEEFIYIIGIIDYLQKYNFKKKIENCFKSLLYGKEKNMISSVEPEYYGDRFHDFMVEKVFIVGENK